MTALGQSNAIEVSKPLPCPFCGSAPDVMELSSIGLRVGFKVACTTVAGCACCPETRVHATHAAAVKAWNTRADPVRAALAVPGVADALAWAMRTYTLTDEYGALRADATGAMHDALRTLADAARGSK